MRTQDAINALVEQAPAPSAKISKRNETLSEDIAMIVLAGGTKGVGGRTSLFGVGLRRPRPLFRRWQPVPICPQIEGPKDRSGEPQCARAERSGDREPASLTMNVAVN